VEEMDKSVADTTSYSGLTEAWVNLCDRLNKEKWYWYNKKHIIIEKDKIVLYKYIININVIEQIARLQLFYPWLCTFWFYFIF